MAGVRQGMVGLMGRDKSPKRYCEECGQVIESKRPGVTLCRRCEEELLSGFRSRDKKRRKDRIRVREFEEDAPIFQARE